MNRKRNRSFILYTDCKQQVSMLSDRDAGRLFKALFDFAESGLEPDFSDAGDLSMCFSFISAQIRRDKEKYDDICEKRAEAGSKGGKQKQANLANANFDKQKQANLADNENDHDSENDSDNKNDRDSDNYKYTEYICKLLNMAKSRTRTKGRLRPGKAAWGHIENLLRDGIGSDQIIAKARQISMEARDIDWYEFEDMFY